MALPVNIEELVNGRTIAREYRNRRIGDILKELRLTEGRATEFPTIYSSMKANSSPPPSFSTDEQTYVLVTLLVHPDFDNVAGNEVSNVTFSTLEDVIAFGNGAGNGVNNQARNQARAIINDTLNDRVGEMLNILTDKIKRDELFLRMKLSNQSRNRARYLDPLINIGWVEMEFRQNRTHPNQTYKTTRSGNRILKLISQR